MSAWNPLTLSVLTTFKDNACAKNGLALIGDRGFAASQTQRPALKLWSWGKEACAVKAVSAERIGPLVATADGSYLVGGGASGRLYLWSTVTGALLKIWDGHYKVGQPRPNPAPLRAAPTKWPQKAPRTNHYLRTITFRFPVGTLFCAPAL